MSEPKLPSTPICKFGVGNLSLADHKRQILTTLIVSLGLFGQGNVAGWSSSGVPSLLDSEDFFDLTSAQTSWIASLVPLGALIATPFCGFGIDQLGRKWTIIIAATVQLLGWMFIISATHVSMLYLGRFITGISVAGFTMAVPVYVSEISDKDIRGSLCIITQLMVTAGLLFAFTFGSFCSWKLLAFFAAFPSVFLIGLSGFIPESQRYYLSQEKIEEAVRVTRWLRQSKTDDEVNDEVNTIMLNLEDLQDIQLYSNGRLFTRQTILPLVSTCTLTVVQQMSGSTTMLYFMVTIFKTAGASLDPYLSTILVGLLMLVSNWGLTLIVDKTGRRSLLLFSGITTTITNIVLALFFSFVSSSSEPSVFGWIPILAVLIYFIAFSFGLGPLPALMMGELLPNHMIGIASAITLLSHFLCAFWMVFSFQAFEKVFGYSIVFTGFALVGFLGSVFIYCTVPETKLKTLEEIQAFYNQKPPLRKTSGPSYETFANSRKSSRERDN